MSRIFTKYGAPAVTRNATILLCNISAEQNVLIDRRRCVKIFQRSTVPIGEIRWFNKGNKMTRTRISVVFAVMLTLSAYSSVQAQDKKAARRHPKHANPDWNHTNSIAYNAQLDQIALSVLGFNEIWIIDHSTNSKHAAGHTGGKSGKGGDLLYRWGNPRAYGAGTAADQHLFAQHDVQWIQHGLKGAGNLLVFNNGRGRPDGNYSSVDEIVPPVDNNGRYMHKAKTAFGPAKPLWSYTASHKTDFYSGHVSGAQRLGNGNTLICAGESGTIFEVTPKKQVVWKYINPVAAQNRPPRNDFKPDRGERPDRDRPIMRERRMRSPG